MGCGGVQAQCVKPANQPPVKGSWAGSGALCSACVSERMTVIQTTAMSFCFHQTGRRINCTSSLQQQSLSSPGRWWWQAGRGTAHHGHQTEEQASPYVWHIGMVGRWQVHAPPQSHHHHHHLSQAENVTCTRSHQPFCTVWENTTAT